MLISIGTAIAAMVGKEASEKVAKILGGIALALALVALLSIGKCAYDNSVIEEHETEREAAASGAREDAADQRAEDAIVNANSEKELLDVVEAAPGGELSPAAHALACERLRRYGRIPPACRPGGGDGAEAGSD